MDLRRRPPDDLRRGSPAEASNAELCAGSNDAVVIGRVFVEPIALCAAPWERAANSARLLGLQRTAGDGNAVEIPSQSAPATPVSSVSNAK